LVVLFFDGTKRKKMTDRYQANERAARRRKGARVFHATFRGAPAVAKLMDAAEFRVLTEAQGPGVVRVFHIAPAKG